HQIWTEKWGDLVLVCPKIEALFVIPSVLGVHVLAERWDASTQSWARIGHVELLLFFIWEIEEPFSCLIHPLDEFLRNPMVLHVEETNFFADTTDFLGNSMQVRTIDQWRKVDDRDFVECGLFTGQTFGSNRCHERSSSVGVSKYFATIAIHQYPNT